VSGNGFIAGVDNGCQTSMEPFKANYRKAFNGMCLLIVQTDKKPGTIQVEATSEGLAKAELKLETRK
jgi:beta-galactosidase